MPARTPASDLIASNNAGVPGLVTVVGSTGVVATVGVGSTGRFTFELAPGVYRFVGHSSMLGEDCIARGPVRLGLHHAAFVVLDCPVR